MESHRASPVQRDQQDVGGLSATQFRNGVAVFARHHHPDGSEGRCASGATSLPEGIGGDQASDGDTQNHLPYGLSAMELHDQTKNTKGIRVKTGSYKFTDAKRPGTHAAHGWGEGVGGEGRNRVEQA